MFTGVFSVLPTPFAGDGSVDVASLRRVVDLFIGAGVDGVTALGVTGEAARLTESERRVVMDTVIGQAAGRIPVIVGASADGQFTCREFSLQAEGAGAAAVMVSPPRLPKLNSETVVAHYKFLAGALKIPIVVQDFPPISGFAMEAPLLGRIAREVPSARTIKLEDPPTPLKIARILEQSEGVPVEILGGLGGVFLLEELMAGAAGAMTGFAYPEILVAIVRHYRAGEQAAASELFYKTVALMRFEFQEGIGMALRKEVLRRRGAITDAGIRAPGARLEAGTRAALDRILTYMEPTLRAAGVR